MFYILEALKEQHNLDISCRQLTAGMYQLTEIKSIESTNRTTTLFKLSQHLPHNTTSLQGCGKSHSERTFFNTVLGVPSRARPEKDIDNSRNGLVERISQCAGVAGPLIVDDSYRCYFRDPCISEGQGKKMIHERTSHEEEGTALYMWKVYRQSLFSQAYFPGILIKKAGQSKINRKGRIISPGTSPQYRKPKVWSP